MKRSPISAHPGERPVPWDKAWLIAGMSVVGAGILYLTFLNFTQAVQSAGNKPDTEEVKVPQYDLTAWRTLPVQHVGRYKPFETACREVMRQIVGREKLNGRDAVAVVLHWMLEIDPANRKAVSQWDDKHFILCGHEEVRKLAYLLDDNGVVQNRALDEKTEDLHGHFMSPNELRKFRKRLATLKKGNVEKYKDVTKPIENQLGDVEMRLALYESIRGIDPYGEETGDDKKVADPRMKRGVEKPSDPFAFVALDAVEGSPWFSLADLRLISRDPNTWRDLYMAERVSKAPQLYISAEHQQALKEFQDKVKAGQGEQAISALEQQMADHRKQTVARFEDLRKSGDKDKIKEADNILDHALPAPLMMIMSKQVRLSDEQLESVKPVAILLMEEMDKKVDKTADLVPQLRILLQQRDQRVLKDLRAQLPVGKQSYDPADPKFRMLHLTYIETRFPNIYKEAATWQAVPAQRIQNVLASHHKLALAYRSEDSERFATASSEYFEALKNNSTPPYPGSDTISHRIGAVLTGEPLNPPSQELLNLEQTFNRVAPFQWAWVLMLISMLFFCLSLGLHSTVCYRIGWAAFLVSLGFQLFGFFVRVTISGRPPVTNMYETVIWVAFMSAIFGAILECIYRKTVIALASTMVATLGLVLADQLPLALDPKINPLVPVLRSNFWLTIHVLVIVSSYAGGTLAWGLGNVALFLILFGKNRGETIKMLSSFTYRALQIAVLLLAAGTFLGGWWAAYSWGRFWGWDPKETGALIALVCYVIPLHMRYIGWIKDFGLAVAAILCYAAILMSWYGVNFVFPAGLHAYGAGTGGALWVYWACLINIEWVLAAVWIYRFRQPTAAALAPVAVPSEAISETVTSEKVSEHVKA